MQRLKLLGLAIMAVFALGAFASSVASAEELPNFLPLAGVNHVTFTGSSGEGKLIDPKNGTTITCTTSTGTGEVTSAKLGTFNTLFEGCKLGAEITCNGLGFTGGLIPVEGEFHLRHLLDGPPQTTVIIILIKHVHFSCGATALFLVLGCVAGTIEPVGSLTKEVKVLFKANAENLQEIMLVDTENGEGMEDCLLKIKKGSEVEELEGTEVVHATLSNFKQNGAAVEALIMG